MSSSTHLIIITGNLGRDPEMRYTPGGQPVTTFSIATTRAYNGSDGQKREETTWFRVTAWGKQAENCNKFLSKGSKVQVIGRMIPNEQGNPRIWNKQDGTPSANFEVNASEVHFLGGGNGGNGGGSVDSEFGDNDEIPF